MRFNANMIEMLSSVQEEYDSVCSQLADCRRKLAEFNAQDEIEAANKRADRIREHSLCVMTDKEMKANREFRAKHYDSCQFQKYSATFEYALTRTGIGDAVHIRCPVCGEEEDITDYDSW